MAPFSSNVRGFSSYTHDLR